MDKEEILRGMKLSRQVHDRLLEEKFVLRSEVGTDTTVTSSYAIEIGDNEPASDRIWLDTSDYASLQGATPNFPMSNGKTLKVVVGDEQPDNYDIWLDTSKYSEE